MVGECGTKRAMAGRKGRSRRPPLDSEKLGELALGYVGRFATTQSKLASYLRRKVDERGWAGRERADIDSVVARLARLGYVDDAAFALSKSRSLTGRGYGERRVRQSLRSAGVDDRDCEPAYALAKDGAVDSALRFARRRRLGPYGEARLDRPARERALAAMIRAGHGCELSKAIVSLGPGDDVDIESLAEKA